MLDTDLFVVRKPADIADLSTWLEGRAYDRSVHGPHLTDATSYRNPMIGLKLGDARAGLVIVHNKEDLFGAALKAVLDCQRADEVSAGRRYTAPGGSETRSRSG